MKAFAQAYGECLGNGGDKICRPASPDGPYSAFSWVMQSTVYGENMEQILAQSAEQFITYHREHSFGELCQAELDHYTPEKVYSAFGVVQQEIGVMYLKIWTAKYPDRICKLDPATPAARLYISRPVTCENSETHYVRVGTGDDGRDVKYCVERTPAPPCPCTDKPIHIGDGRKVLSELQFSANSGEFRYFYNSAPFVGWPRVMRNGKPERPQNWRHSYEPTLRVTEELSNNMIVAVRPNGLAHYFSLSGQELINPEGSGKNRIEQVLMNGAVTGWQYRNAQNDEVEAYNLDGDLISITSRSGFVRKLIYSDGTDGSATGKGDFLLDAAGQPSTSIVPKGVLLSVVDSFGNKIRFFYNEKVELVKVQDPSEHTIQYGWNGKKDIHQMLWPDGSSRRYFYSEPAYIAEGSEYKRLLTGMQDENGVRIMSYNYSANGRAVEEKFEGIANVHNNKLLYSTSNTGASVFVTNPLGAESLYAFKLIGGVFRPIALYPPVENGSPAVSETIDYDGNGNVLMRKAFNGTVTKYLSYDLTRNLETKRVEAADTPLARTITTQWHPTYRLPIKIIEPLKVTNFKYDTSGNLLEKSVQATKDTTGAQGTAAAVTGSIRTWKYTYNAVGQMLTETDPAAAVTTYTYDVKGNLETFQNALGHITKYSNYDGNGRVGRIEDPNGLVEELTYTPRGWLETRTVKGQQWRYAYDPAGQLKKVTSPDGTFVSYDYDGAHRLTKVSDSLGNSISYTLDAAGNRTAEEVKDPTNVLVRKVSRTYDTLNRLKQQVGGAL
jgi:YD repeat-containing protein